MYKLNGKNNIFNILETVAENRGVNLKKFLNYSKKDIVSPYLLSNMRRAVDLFKKHQMNAKESKVTVLIDSDP